MDELKKFRQLHSKTAGHPESASRPAWKPPPARWARASANAVGMALAEKLLAAEFNREEDGQLQHRRPLHLRLPGRRLPDGRHQP
jgi:transketolase